MKIEIDEDYTMVLKEVFNSIVLETSEGNRLAICMRDDTFEMTIPGSEKWFRANIKNGTIEEIADTNKYILDKMPDNKEGGPR